MLNRKSGHTPGLEEFVYVLLTYVNEHNRWSLTVNDFYGWDPFDTPNKQYPGNVIQYLFMKTKDLEDKDRGLNKERIFNELARLLTEPNITTFTARDCATTLHKIATILTTDLKNGKVP